MTWRIPLLMLAGWIQREQAAVIEYLKEENRVLRDQLKGKRLQFSDSERQRLATRAYPLSKQTLEEVATIVTPKTLLRWYRQLVAKKFDGSEQRKRSPGRPPVAIEIEALVVRIPREQPSFGYRRIQGALASLGYEIDGYCQVNENRLKLFRRSGIDMPSWAADGLIGSSKSVQIDLQVGHFRSLIC